jgi:hypothetical protein
MIEALLILTASSLVSAIFFHSLIFYLLFFPLPGIIFGIAMVVIYDLLNISLTKKRKTLVILCSTLGMLAATWVYFYFALEVPEKMHGAFSSDQLDLIAYGGFILASISGAVITLIPNIFKWAISGSKFWYAIGLFLALIVGLLNLKLLMNKDEGYSFFTSVCLFFSWQLVMGTYIILIKRKFTKEEPLTTTIITPIA